MRSMELAKAFGMVLGTEKRKRDLSYSELATLTGVSRELLNHYVLGLKSPNMTNLFKVCLPLNISLDNLMTKKLNYYKGEGQK